MVMLNLKINPTLSSPKWREKKLTKIFDIAFSPKARQCGEKKHFEILTQYEGITVGLIEGKEFQKFR